MTTELGNTMTIELGPANGSLTLNTTRAGMAAKAGHDLVIAIERWSATLDPEAGSLTATIDATSLRVLEGRGGVKPLSESDKADIAKTINEKILKTAQNPEITFVSSSISGIGTARWTIDGQLTLAAVTQPVQIPVNAPSAGDEIALSATVTVVQSQFGIKPYSGLMGALKVADPIEFKGEARIPSSALPA